VTQRVKFLKAWFRTPCTQVLEEYVGLLGAEGNRMENPTLFARSCNPRALGTGSVISTFSPVLNNTHGAVDSHLQSGANSLRAYLNLYDIGWDRIPEGHRGAE